jgi:hypothetical protein
LSSNEDFRSEAASALLDLLTEAEALRGLIEDFVARVEMTRAKVDDLFGIAQAQAPAMEQMEFGTAQAPVRTAEQNFMDEALRFSIDPDTSRVDDGKRTRSTPFRRMPSEKAQELVYGILKEGGDEWTYPNEVARRLGGGNRRAREYFRNVINRECRELWEQNLVERDFSERVGSQWRYRLKNREELRKSATETATETATKRHRSIHDL